MRKVTPTIWFLIISICMPLMLRAEISKRDTVYSSREDSLVFKRYLAYMSGKDTSKFDSLLISTALFFIGTPYVGGTLEIEPEGLVINLRELDCFTFVENVISLSRMYASGDTTIGRFYNNLRELRYRDGAINRYTDRLHYTSDWMYENDRKQILKYLSSDIGGKPYKFNLSYMSTHPKSYKQIAADTALVPLISNIEHRVTNRNSYAFIPEKEIDSLAVNFNNGDVVGFLTTTKGLDISHVGIISRTGGSLTFIHASSVAKQVIINPEPLINYVTKSSSCNGIMLARPLSPLTIETAQKQTSHLYSENSPLKNLRTKLYRKYDYRYHNRPQYRKAEQVSITD